MTTRIETATQELEQIGFQLLSDYGPDPETAEALEQSSIELLRRAVEQLDNGRHILIMPILRLHIDAGDAVLVSQHQLSGKQQLLLLLRQLVSALYLSQLQSDLYGYDHYALAQTHNDIAQAMEHVIHLSPTDTAYKHALEVGQQFAHLKSTSMSFPVDVTSMRSRARYHHEEHERIKTLYPDTAA